MRDLYAGLDVSTQGCKIVVVDAEAGDLLHQDALSYDDDLPAYGTVDGTVPGLGEGVAEADPRMWLEAVQRLLERVREGCDPARIACLSVSAQMHGLVALDRRGELARPRAKLWHDTSTAEECRLLHERLGGREQMLAEIANVQRPGYTAAKILHLRRREPQRYRRTARFLVVHDFVNWFLTGGAAGGVAVSEWGEASGTGLFDPVGKRWSRRLLESIDPGLSGKLPAVGPPDRTIGTVAPALARRFGLPPECRVDAGSGDNMYGALGTGNHRPGHVTVTLGTSGTAATIRQQPWPDPTGEVACYVDATGRYLSLLCVANLAEPYAAVRRRLGLSHEQFDRAAAGEPAGNGGRLLLPWVRGERSPDLPLATPVAFGFDLGGDSAGALCRAVLEGTLLNLHAGAERLPGWREMIAERPLRVTGGLVRSAVWLQALADVFGCEAVPVPAEATALGAAIHAAWVHRRESGRPCELEQLCEALVPLERQRRVRPRPDAARAYRLQRRLYRALRERILGRSGSGEDPFALRAQLRAETASLP